MERKIISVNSNSPKQAILGDRLFKDKTLVFTDNKQSLNRQAIEYSNAKKVPYVFVSLQNTQDLSALEKDVIVEGARVRVDDGKLLKAIKQGGIVVVDYQNSHPKLVVGFNELFDKIRRYKGVKAHPDFKIIGLIDKTSNKYANSFWGRFTRTIKTIGATVTFPKLSYNNKQEDIHIDLLEAPNWKEKLIGSISLLESGPVFKEGALITAIKNNKKISISGLNTGDEAVQLFLDEIFINKQIRVNGKEYNTPEGFSINIIDKNYEDTSKIINIVKGNNSFRDCWVVNNENIDELFKFTQIKNTTLLEKSGILKSKNKKLVVTDNLPTWVWHQIMHNSQISSISVLDNIEVPREYDRNVNREPEQKPELFNETNKRIICEDIAYELNLIKMAEGDNNVEIVHISSKMKKADLFGSIHLKEKNDGGWWNFSSGEQGDIVKSLEEGKTVVITDLSINGEIAMALESIFVGAYITIKGERIELDSLPGRIIVLESGRRIKAKDNNYKSIYRINFEGETKKVEQKQLQKMIQEEFSWVKDEDYSRLYALLENVNNAAISEDSVGYQNIRQILCIVDGSNDKKISPKRWYRAINAVITDKYEENAELSAYIKTLIKSCFNYNSLSKNSFNINKVNNILDRVKRGQNLSAYYWQLVETISTDYIKDNISELEFANKDTNLINDIACYYKGISSKYEVLFSTYNNSTELKGDSSPLNTRSFFDRSFDRAKYILEKYPAVFLKGSPGVGKTYSCERLAISLGFSLDDVFGPITTGEDIANNEILGSEKITDKGSIFENELFLKFAKAEKGVLVVDESNLPEDGFWEFYRSIIEKEPYIYYNGQRIDIKNPSQKKVIFTGNQESVAKRKEHRLIKDFFVTVMFKEFDLEYLQKLIAGKYFNSGFTGLIDEKKVEYAKNIIFLYEKIKTLTGRDHFSIRDIQEVCRRFKSEKYHTIETFLGSFYSVYGNLLTNEESAAFKIYLAHKYKVDIDTILEEKEQTYLKINDLGKNLTDSGVVINKETASYISNISEFLINRESDVQIKNKTREGKNCILAEGPSGRGKDFVLEEVLVAKNYIDYKTYSKLPGEEKLRYESNKKVYIKWNANVDYDELFDLIDEAQNKGFVVIISEANILSSSILEGRLNDKLSGESSTGFSLFMTINSIDYSGRENLSSALLNRSVYLQMRDYNQDELLDIVRTNANERKNVKDLVSFHCWLRTELKKKSVNTIIPTLRQVLSVVKLVNAGQSLEKAISAVYEAIYIPQDLAQDVKEKKYKKFIENEFLNIGVVYKFLGDMLTSDVYIDGQKKGLRIDTFEAEGEGMYGAAQYDVAKHGISFNKIIWNNKLKRDNSFFHELGHAKFSRLSNFNDASYNSLVQDLEDLRVYVSMKQEFSDLEAPWDISAYQLFASWIKNHDLSSIKSIEFKDIFSNIVGCYALGLITERDLLNIKWSNQSKTDQVIQKMINNILEDKYELDGNHVSAISIIHKAVNSIAVINSHGEYSEVDNLYASDRFNKLLDIIKEEYLAVPRNIEVVAKTQYLFKRAKPIGKVNHEESITSLKKLVNNIANPIEKGIIHGISNYKWGILFGKLAKVGAISKIGSLLGLSEVNNGSGSNSDTSVTRHREGLGELYIAARKDPKYNNLSDNDLRELCQEALYGKGYNPMNEVAKDIVTEDDKNPLIKIQEKKIINKLSKSKARESIVEYLQKIARKWVPSSYDIKDFSFIKEYGKNGQIDMNQFMKDQVNYRLKSGGTEKLEKKELIIYKKDGENSVNNIATDAIDSLITLGYKVSILSANTELQENISGSADLSTITNSNNISIDDMNQIKNPSSFKLVSLSEVQEIVEKQYIIGLIDHLAQGKNMTKNATVATQKSTAEVIFGINKILDEDAILVEKNGVITEIKFRKTLTTEQFNEIVSKYEKELKNVEELYLNGTQITDKIGPYLEKLTSLNRLDLSGTKVTDGIGPSLETLISLKVLSLISTQITDKIGPYLEKLTSLNRLDLCGTKVTDGIVPYLKKLPSLIGLDLSGLRITYNKRNELLAFCKSNKERIAQEKALTKNATAATQKNTDRGENQNNIIKSLINKETIYLELKEEYKDSPKLKILEGLFH